MPILVRRSDCHRQRRVLSIGSALDDWIELLFGLDPDHVNGSIEWGLATAVLVAEFLCMSDLPLR
jgi:hypothetical protein